MIRAHRFAGVASLVSLAIIGIGQASRAQAPAAPPASPVTFPDVPTNHWAYDAVTDLANKGYVKGYPDGAFYGHRDLTRYEFAMVVERILQTITEMNAKIATIPPAPPATPTGTFATQDDLNKIQLLVDTFKPQIDTLTADVKALKDAGYQDEIDALRQDVADTKDLVAAAQKKLRDTSYGTGLERDADQKARRLQITGYVQARYQAVQSGNKAAYPEGLGAVTGATGSFNGNYAIGGTTETFAARRARLKAAGRVTDNTRYAVQVDAGGFTTNGTAPNNVTVREANASYTFGSGDDALFPKLTAGLFANWFGYEINESSANIVSPERPLAFNEGGSGLFINQDYDRGVQLNLPFAKNSVFVTAGLVNGNGLNGLTGGGATTTATFNATTGVTTNTTATVAGGGNDNNSHVDGIYRIGYQTNGTPFTLGAAKTTFAAGASYYDGRIPRPGIVAGGTAGYVGANYQEGKKQLYGFDARLGLKAGGFLLGEYVDGKYDLRTFFNSNTSLTSNSFAPGNKVEGYYGQAGWAFNNATSHPLTLAVSYDYFNRSQSGIASTATGGASGSSFEDVNIGYGVLYNLDKASRLRFWYDKPDKVAHAANVAAPSKIGLITGEYQIKF